VNGDLLLTKRDQGETENNQDEPSPENRRFGVTTFSPGVGWLGVEW
jgi:hypothetical protein